MFNSTTVEHLAVARMKERERAILARMFGVFEIRYVAPVFATCSDNRTKLEFKWEQQKACTEEEMG